MPARYTVVCKDSRAREIRRLAQQYDLTEEAVIRQVIDLGLDQTETEPPSK